MSSPGPLHSPEDTVQSPLGIDADADPLHDAQGEPEGIQTGLDPPMPPKRKGGRKPIYATSEERKQRNRQAQAAFRERRTEYIKQMEATAKDHNDAMDELRHQNQSLADECTALRYKASLLEQLLEERAIDYRSELAARSNQSLFGQALHTDLQLQTPRQYSSPDERLQLKRQSTNGITPKLNGGLAKLQPAHRHCVTSPASSLPSPSSFNFPSLSPRATTFGNMSTSDATRRSSGQVTNVPPHHVTPQQQTNELHPRSSYVQRETVSHDVKPIQRVDDYRHSGSYDYLSALQQSHPRTEVQYLGK